MKKGLLIFIAFIGIFGLIGCANGSTKVQETKQLKIEPTTVKEEKVVGDHKIIKIHYKLENKTKDNFNVASNDFIIKSNGDYYYMGSGINFSDTLKKQEKFEGDGYYEVPKDLKNFTLMYQPLGNNERAQWDLEISK